MLYSIIANNLVNGKSERRYYNTLKERNIDANKLKDETDKRGFNATIVSDFHSKHLQIRIDEGSNE